MTTEVITPTHKHLKGFDVASVYDMSVSCSPLSCHSLANQLPVNTYCLFDSLECTKHAVENGAFDQGESGPYRIFSVYTVD